jgi:hypothetical protein
MVKLVAHSRKSHGMQHPILGKHKKAILCLTAGKLSAVMINPTNYSIEISLCQFDSNFFVGHFKTAEVVIEPPVVFTAVNISKFSFCTVLYGSILESSTTIANLVPKHEKGRRI